MTMVIEKIERHAKRIAAGKAKVKPGQPHRMSEAMQAGDYGWQGDLKITVLDKVPADYLKLATPSVADRQLVPGNTEGAKHCLDSLKGVAMFRPAGWPQSAESDYCGPALVLAHERTILHPTHGSVTIPAGFTVRLDYQREFDAETQRSRRNAD